ncbi:hypothetical protein G3578_00060 [Brevibacillus sp. SYP-B805]|nr:hypothetical protein [Brevibacillus sp. SYP-B805]
MAPGAISFVLVMAITLALQLYYRYMYDFPIFPSAQDSRVNLFILCFIGVILLFVGIVTHFIGRGNPHLHNPIVANTVLFMIIFLFSLLFFWFYPLGQKWEYAQILNRAKQVLTKYDPQTNQEITVHLLYSGRISSGRGSSPNPYRNLFMVKNHLDRPVQAQVMITAKNQQNEEIEVHESSVIPLQPGEYRMVITDETDLNRSVWNRWTFETWDRIADYSYQYRYW